MTDFQIDVEPVVPDEVWAPRGGFVAVLRWRSGAYPERPRRSLRSTSVWRTEAEAQAYGVRWLDQATRVTTQ